MQCVAGTAHGHLFQIKDSRCFIQFDNHLFKRLSIKALLAMATAGLFFYNKNTKLFSNHNAKLFSFT